MNFIPLDLKARISVDLINIKTGNIIYKETSPSFDADDMQNFSEIFESILSILADIGRDRRGYFEEGFFHERRE